MNYKLNEIKDAGFPIPPCPEWVIRGDGVMAEVEWRDMYTPDLSTLIKECGDVGLTLSASVYHDGQWKAYAGKFIGEGSAPEEAVANLWLALNKK